MQDGLTLDERSAAAPAVASARGRLDLAWTDADTHVNVASSNDGRHFGARQRLQYTSWRVRPGAGSEETLEGGLLPLGPALAATVTGFHLAWTGSDRRVNIVREASPPTPVTLADTSMAAPALTPWGEDVLLAWTGTDRRVHVARSRDGACSASARLKAKSLCSPAVCSLGGEVVLAWAGTDFHINVTVSDQGSFRSAVRLEAKSPEAPALCAVGGEVALAWVGTDRRVNLVVGELGARPLRLDQRSRFSPSICAWDGGIILAWTGTDRRLNLMPLNPARVAR
jgi:hypothetical protein